MGSGNLFAGKNNGEVGVEGQSVCVEGWRE